MDVESRSFSARRARQGDAVLEPESELHTPRSFDPRGLARGSVAAQMKKSCTECPRKTTPISKNMQSVLALAKTNTAGMHAQMLRLLAEVVHESFSCLWREALRAEKLEAVQHRKRYKSGAHETGRRLGWMST